MKRILHRSSAEVLFIVILSFQFGTFEVLRNTENIKNKYRYIESQYEKCKTCCLKRTIF